MQACLFETRPSHFMKPMVDLRYFYQDTNGCVHYSCGMAFQALMFIYRKETFLKPRMTAQHNF